MLNCVKREGNCPTRCHNAHFDLSCFLPRFQNMAITHLQDACVAIPRNIREDLAQLHKIRETTSGGKPYWAQCCSSMGLIEDEHGLRFAGDAAAAAANDDDADDGSSRRLSTGSGTIGSPGSPKPNS